jgi:hypothetical protein
MEDVGALAAERDHPRVERDDDLALAARTDPDAFGLLYERHRLSVRGSRSWRRLAPS